MLRRTLTGGTPTTFLSSLLDFCVDSASTCFSRDADKRCVPIGLSSLSALLLLLSCFLLLYERRRSRDNKGEWITFFYSLLGNLCTTVGAILSRQLHIQVLMGAVAAAVDAVHFISCCFPVLLCCWNSKAERRLRMMRGQRRQCLLAVCVLMVVAGGFLKSRVSHSPPDSPLSKRRLLHVTIQDNTEILGYILGLLSFVIACTSRLPSLRRAHRGQMLTLAYIISTLLCSLAGALYAAAILLYDTHFMFLLRVMPWLLSAICCAALDLLILVIHCCMRGSRQQLTSFSPDTERLLGGLCTASEDESDMKRQRTQQLFSSTPTKTKNVQKMTELGRYMDVSFQPSRKEVSKEKVEDKPFTGEVRVVRVNSFCFSDTSCDSSTASSDLEWDFEETNAQWSGPTAKQQFPPQGWRINPKPFNMCTCPMSGFSQKTLSGTEEEVMKSMD